MSSAVKKRKLQHASGDLGRAAAAASRTQRTVKASTNVEPRFQLDSDFSDSDDQELDTGAAGVGPSLGTTRSPSQVAQHKAGGGATLEGPDSDDDGDTPGTEHGSDEAPSSDDDGPSPRPAARTPAGADAGPAGGELASAEGAGGGSAGGDEDGGGKQQQEGGNKKKVLSKRKLERVKEASDRRGIVYISRIPPHMKPNKLRRLLEPFGAIGRVYCAAEDTALRHMRKKKGGNTGKNFTEGWVEFEDKRLAKRAAVALNGQPMGGSKRSAHYYDLWCMKYLPKFKWDTLTEEINYQRAVREQRLVTEISAAKRERDFYLSRVDKAKAITAIQERRSKKQRPQEGEQEGVAAAAAAAATGTASAPHQAARPPATGAAAAAAPASGPGAAGGSGAFAGGGGKASGGPRGILERHFGQRRVKADPVSDEAAPVLSGDVLGLLGGKGSSKGGR